MSAALDAYRAGLGNIRDIDRKSAPYHYKPLSQLNTIRLPKLDTIDNPVTIPFQLETFTLGSSPPHFALSYA
jgi:hypothetical protein